MGIRNFSKNDLLESNLPELVRQLREAVSNKEYDTVEQFARAFATEIQSSTILVDQRTGQGKRVLDVNGEMADVSSSVSAIITEIDKSRNASETDPAKVAAYEKMYAAVDSQLTALFMQDKMMEELATRGFSAEEYADQAVEANKRSDDKIKVYNNKIKAYQAIEKKVLEPHPVVNSIGNVKEVSLKTKLEDEKNAKVYLEGLTHDIETIKKLEEAINNWEAEIAADSTKEAMYRGKIDANKSQVAQLTNDMKGKVASLKDLHLDSFNIASIENCEDPAKMSRDNAETAINALHSGMDTRILNAYKKIATNLLDKKKAGEHTFDATEKTEISKINSTNVDEVEQGKKAIEAAMIKIEKVITDNTKYKKQEETLKIAREKSTAEFARVSKRVKELEVKFERVQAVDDQGRKLYVDEHGNETIEATNPTTGAPNAEKWCIEQLCDKDGNPLYIDSRGNVTKEATDPITGTHNVKYETDYQPTKATQDEYLRDAHFDKTAEENTIKTNKETEIKGLSWRDRRALLKQYGIGNPFTRLFSSKRLMNSQIPTLVAGEANSELENVERRAQEIINKAANAERIEYDDVVIAEERTKRTYQANTKAAALQREIANGAYDNNEVLRNRTINQDAVNAMQDAALEQTSLIMARALLAGRDLAIYEDAMTRYTYKQVAREHNQQKGINDSAKNPQHEDLTR